MCIGHNQHESLIVITIVGMVAAVLLPALQAANEHIGLPAWTVLLAVGVGAIVGAFVIIFGFLFLSEVSDRYYAWRENQRRR